MQQRGILRHHPDLRAQAGLRGRGDVLTIDQHAPLMNVIKTQQQIDDGALAGPGSTHQTDLFARLDVQIEIFDHPRVRRLRIVSEADPFEADLFAARHVEGQRAGLVDDRRPQGQGVHAVLNRAHLLEQRGHFPHDPVGYTV